MNRGAQLEDALLAAGRGALERAAEALLRVQHREGYWRADLTADSTLESDYILLQLWLHPPVNGRWNPPTRDRIDMAAKTILRRQAADGGFNIYPNGPSDVSASVKAYFALKLAGLRVDDERMIRLRDRILALGGIQAANSYVKINLSLFNLYPRKYVPAVPPELMLAGRFIYEMSSWTRAIVIPLAIVHSANPSRPVPDGFELEELIKPGVSMALANEDGFFSWRNFFLTADRALKLYEEIAPRFLRGRAVARAEAWLLERTRYSDGLGAIYPAMMYAVMAMDVLGYPPDHPDRAEAQAQFDRLMVHDERGFFFQPCFSVVWDTAIAAFALGESGVAPEAELERCATWLLSKEVRRKGDWSVKRPRTEPSGWYFEFANEFYPDIDDTAMVLLALRHARSANRKAQEQARQRAVQWLLDMQSKDGGWAAFDVDNNWRFLNYIPFADHNAMLDPSCPDITGRVLEALAVCGIELTHPAMRRGVQYLVNSQEQDGSWYGRWGVDYLYGTFLALRGLRAAGEDEREAHILRAGEWLRSIQNADGGWGESCESYERAGFASGQSTASQTAWAVLGLLASGDTTSQSVRKGVEYLIETQGDDGRWREELATGTGFPRVFYLVYHLYKDAFPLLALGTYFNQTLRPSRVLTARGVSAGAGFSVVTGPIQLGRGERTL
jgi:squalene-hopene/tetraprenyl-beta-curcumene cyclase